MFKDQLEFVGAEFKVQTSEFEFRLDIAPSDVSFILLSTPTLLRKIKS